MPSVGRLCKLPANGKAGTETPSSEPSPLHSTGCGQPSPAGPAGQGRKVVSLTPARCQRLWKRRAQPELTAGGSAVAGAQPGCGARLPAPQGSAAGRRCQGAPGRRDGVSWWSSATGIQSPGRPRSPPLGEASGNG